MTLDIWAFVRVMVYLEEQGGRSALFMAWSEDWEEVDARLADLAATDFEAYSDMMMETQIDLNLPADLRPEFVDAVEAVRKELIAKKRASTDAEFQKDLEFEIQGLGPAAAQAR